MAPAFLAVFPSPDDGLVQAVDAGVGPRDVVGLHLQQSVLQVDGEGETLPGLVILQPHTQIGAVTIINCTSTYYSI